MGAVAIIQAASVGIGALLQVIAKAKSASGLTDEQIMEEFQQHDQATQQAIAGYLANTPA